MPQERDELKLTIKRLMHRLYVRRSERRVDAAGQLYLNFGDLPAQDATPSPLMFEDVTIRRTAVTGCVSRKMGHALARRALRPVRRTGPT